MKLSELRSVAGDQLETGRKAKDELEESRRSMETAEVTREERYDSMAEAMEVDEDYRPKGDIIAANDAFERAKEEYLAASDEVDSGEEALEEINAQKRETIQSLDEYIEEIQGYRSSLEGAADNKFGHNLKPLDDTFGAHIEEAEDLRDELLTSLDEGVGGRSGGGGSFGASSEGTLGAAFGEGFSESGQENAGESGSAAEKSAEQAYRDQIMKERAERFRQKVMNDPMTQNPRYSGVRQPPGSMGPCLTFGINDEALGKLSYAQGNNTEGWEQDCAIAQIANILTMAGRPTSEEEVVQHVKNNRGRMSGNPMDSSIPSMNGGMIPRDIATVLGDFGIPGTVHSKNSGIIGGIRSLFGAGGGMDLDQVADAVESGHGVIMGVDCDGLNGHPGSTAANHAITVVGTARDIDTHEVRGFYINDTGWPDIHKDGRLERSQTKFVPLWRMRNAYEVPNSAVILTNVIIR